MQSAQNLPRLACFFGILVALSVTQTQSVTAATPEYSSGVYTAEILTNRWRESVALAQQGSAAQALGQLETLADSAHLLDQLARERLIVDIGVVASWAERHEAAVQRLSSIPMRQLPDFGVLALAKSARELSDYSTALAAYQHLRAVGDASTEVAVAYVHTLSAAGRKKQAEQFLDNHLPDHPRQKDSVTDIPLLLACGSINSEHRRHTASLHCYDRVLEIEPENAGALVGRDTQAQLIGAHGLPTQGYVTNSDPGTGRALRDQIDSAALHIRWSALPAKTEVDRLLKAEQAIRLLDAIMQEEGIEQFDTSIDWQRTLLFDRVTALTAAQRMQEATSLYEQVNTSPERELDIPAYAAAAAGQAYLFLERPELAASAYQIALEQKPENFDYLVGAFFAESDRSNYRAAEPILERILATQEQWRRPDPAVWLENSAYARAIELEAISRAYRNDYASALERLDELQDIAPASSSIRVSRANVYRWRGWAKRAVSESRRALSIDSTNIYGHLALSDSALETREYPVAEASVDYLNRVAPNLRDVQRVTDRWRWHSQPQLYVRAGGTRASDSPQGTTETKSEATLYSAPLRYQIRVFLRDTYSAANFEEGRGTDHRVGAGFDYEKHSFGLSTWISKGLEDIDSVGLNARASFSPGDRFTTEIALASESQEVPLRGRRIGISGESVNWSAGFRWSESRSLTTSVGLARFDDDNKRKSASIVLQQRLYTRPRHQFDALLRSYQSSNSIDNAVYFNPSKDRSNGIGLVHHWQPWRRYDRGLSHRMEISAAQYDQEGFSKGVVWNVNVEQIWNISQRIALEYGASYGRNRFDGVNSNNVAAFLALRSSL